MNVLHDNPQSFLFFFRLSCFQSIEVIREVDYLVRIEKELGDQSLDLYCLILICCGSFAINDGTG